MNRIWPAMPPTNGSKLIIARGQEVHCLSMPKPIRGPEANGRPFKTIGARPELGKPCIESYRNRRKDERGCAVSAYLLDKNEKNRKALELGLGKTVR